jgi:transcriptional regulator with XRE-family HTH domain
MASHEEVAQRFGAEVAALRSEGLSMARVAERVGLSYQAVRFVLDPESERAAEARGRAGGPRSVHG